MAKGGSALTRYLKNVAPSRGRVLLMVFAGPTLTSCSGPGNMLDPAGPAARRIAGLWWLMLIISTVVFLVVLGMIAVGLLRSRRRDARVLESTRLGNTFVLVAGIVVPCLILGAVFLVALRDMAALSAPPSEPTETIEVIARDWWWEVRYPDGGVVTANEIHIPAGESVQLHLTTSDVMHSFWVPRLQAKIDHVPGTTNTLWLSADQPGRFRGQCAEFCGLQHANMIFWVEAEPRAEYEQWLEEQAAPASSASEGEELFLSSSCAGCHAVQGTEADGSVGPDLTHVMSRDTLLAGVLDTSRESLRRIVIDPQGVKPGITMPPSDFDADQLEALLDYLEELR